MTGISEDLEYRKANSQSARRIQAELISLWAHAREDEQELLVISDMLGIPSNVIKQMQDPPVRVKAYQSNVSGAEIGLIVGTWLVSEVVLGAVKDLLKEELKRRLKLFWDYASDQIDLKMGSSSTGSSARSSAELDESEQPKGARDD